MMQADSDCIAAKNNNMVSRSLAVVLDAVDTNPTNDTLIAGDRQKYEKASVTDAVTVSVSDCNGIVPLLTLPGTNNALPPSDGKAIFDDFVWGNKDCYWDPHLKESVENLKYIGCLHPSTLLVGGRDIYIDTIKNAWARRVLRPPVGFTLQQIGTYINRIIVDAAVLVSNPGPSNFRSIRLGPNPVPGIAGSSWRAGSVAS